METGAASFSADDLLAVGKALAGKSVGDLEHGAARALATAAPCPAVPSPACAVPSPACVPCRRQRLLHCASRSHCQRWHNARACLTARLSAPAVLCSVVPGAGGSLFLLSAADSTSMLDLVLNSFEIR